MKQLVIKIAYSSFVLPKDSDFSKAVELIGQLLPVNAEYVDGKNIYTPDKECSITFDLVDSKQIRPTTPVEKENQKIKELENSISYRNNQIKEKDKRIKELECITDAIKED